MAKKKHKKPASQDTRETPMDPENLTWDRIKHDDSLFAQRASFFLVAQSVLAAALAILIGTVPTWQWRHVMLVWMLSVAAIVVSLVWAHTSWHYRMRRAALYEWLEDCCQPFSDSPRPPQPKPHTNDLMGTWLPFCFVAFWIMAALAFGR